jgi:hypothetical protein
MQIFALLAALGATLGQPDDPPDQAAQSAEQQQADVDDSAAQPPAEEPEANADSDREEQPAERQEADTDSAAEQPAEAGNDEAGAELDQASPEASVGAQQDEATRRRRGNWDWWRWPHNGVTYFRSRDNGPFTVEYTTTDHRQEQLQVSASVQGSPSPEQWAALEEQARAWLCASDAAVFTTGERSVIVLTLHGETGPGRTVTISDCRPR